jgi:hypothetical protein
MEEKVARESWNNSVAEESSRDDIKSQRRKNLELSRDCLAVSE